jgi:type IV pilus assembly protein PilP
LDTKAGGGNQDSDYFYDATGKTDPFKSFIAEEDEISNKKKRKPRTYLETLDLSQLELIAVMLSPKGNWAMVRESKGTGHTIRVGTAIGTNGGIVHEISDKIVVIREEYKDYKGNTVYRDITKKLPSLQ